MKPLTLSAVLLTTILILITGRAFSQEDTCEEIIETAVQSIDESCNSLGNNQACYGHELVEADAQANAPEFSFARPGDVADLIELQTLRVSALDANAGFWGIAQMQLLAQLRNENPEQVSLLIFGSVALESIPSPSVRIRVEIVGNNPVRIRQEPFDSSLTILQLDPGTHVVANGRVADTSWLRIELPDSGGYGWVFARSVATDEDLTTLPVIERQAAHFGPLQAFRLGTSVASGSPCESTPPDGLLVQTPEGIAEITFLVNEVNIQLRATAFVQAQAGHEMIVAVIDGQARVEANGVVRIVRAGEMTRIDLDANLSPTSAPTEPEPYRSVILNVKQLLGLFGTRGSNVNQAGTLEELLEPSQVTAPSTSSDAVAPSVDTPPEPTAIPANPDQNNQNNSSSSGGGSSGDGGGGGAPPGGGGGPPGGGGGPPG